jgi:hypothetical protein
MRQGWAAGVVVTQAASSTGIKKSSSERTGWLHLVLGKTKKSRRG